MCWKWKWMKKERKFLRWFYWHGKIEKCWVIMYIYLCWVLVYFLVRKVKGVLREDNCTDFVWLTDWLAVLVEEWRNGRKLIYFSLGFLFLLGFQFKWIIIGQGFLLFCKSFLFQNTWFSTQNSFTGFIFLCVCLSTAL